MRFRSIKLYPTWSFFCSYKPLGLRCDARMLIKSTGKKRSKRSFCAVIVAVSAVVTAMTPRRRDYKAFFKHEQIFCNFFRIAKGIRIARESLKEIVVGAFTSLFFLSFSFVGNQSVPKSEF